MEIFYRLLGLMAGVSHRMSRLRVNFMPINLLLGIGATALAVLFLNNTRESATNSDKPVVCTIGDILAGKNPQQFVKVSGELEPEIALEAVMVSSRSNTKTTTARYLLLVDKAAKQGLFVQVNPDEMLWTEPQPFTTQGMVTTAERDLAQQIDIVGSQIGGAVDTKHVLKHGSNPARLIPSIALSALFALASLLFWITFAWKYVVFRRDSRETISATHGGSYSAGHGAGVPEVSVIGTGPFVLDTGAKQRFLGMPCGTVELETGDAGYVCNVDASSRFMGATTTKREGLWIMAVKRDGTPRFERGRQYLGLGCFPAVKVDFTDPLVGKQQSAILGFETEADREATIGYLSSVGATASPHFSRTPDAPDGSSFTMPPDTGSDRKT